MMHIHLAKQAIKHLWYLLILVSLACVPEEEIIVSQPAKSLTFSADTILFDTIFSDIQSVTRYLQVRNPNERAVNIASIELAGGHASAYQLYVNGQPGSQFDNFQLLGGDSLLILVEVQINPQDQNLPFLVKDSILFNTGNFNQDVKLVTWGQDAHFLKGLVIDSDTIFTSDRPYVVYDSLWVAASATLRMEAGTQVYFNTNAGLLVDGTLLIEGTQEKQVLLRSDRSDGNYAYYPGQWSGIFFSESSKNNRIDYAVLRNAIIGIGILGGDADTVADLTLANTKIKNTARYGLRSIGADVDAYNLVIDSCAYNLIQHNGKGYHRYLHCTFNNNYSQQAAPALFFADTASLSAENNQAFQLVLKNNIIWGNRREEFSVLTAEPDSQFEITSNLIKTQRVDAFGEKNIFNEEPQFVNGFLPDYHLDSLSVAINKGVLTQVLQDIEGNKRDSLPDLGAYEYIKE